MRATAKKYFIPHEENNYHPHILHAKRIVLYGGVGLLVKGIVMLVVFAVPLGAFMAEDALEAQAIQIASLTNDLRAQNGAPPLSVSRALSSSSREKAHDMAGSQYFSHTGPDGKTLASWIRREGYDYEVVGENLAMGFFSAEQVVDAWRKSGTHYANLIDKDFKDIGVGAISGEYNGAQTIFVAQHFAAPRNSGAQGSFGDVRPNKESRGDGIAVARAEPIQPTPIEKYTYAKSLGSTISQAFAASRWIYIGLIALFGVALALTIVIEMKKQHPHVIAQTLALIGLFAFLLKV
ncbi:CAP domain-containing protein [Candidatus Uhrbacteria bacterium]|nr:CAP domain-containing protein [Candidatus Uhrbacteria bacterium]